MEHFALNIYNVWVYNIRYGFVPDMDWIPNLTAVGLPNGEDYVNPLVHGLPMLRRLHGWAKLS